MDTYLLLGIAVGWLSLNALHGWVTRSSRIRQDALIRRINDLSQAVIAASRQMHADVDRAILFVQLAKPRSKGLPADALGLILQESSVSIDKKQTELRRSIKVADRLFESIKSVDSPAQAKLRSGRLIYSRKIISMRKLRVRIGSVTEQRSTIDEVFDLIEPARKLALSKAIN